MKSSEKVQIPFPKASVLTIGEGFANSILAQFKPAFPQWDDKKRRCLYTLWKNGELQYLGQTTFLYNRRREHKKTKDFDEVRALTIKGGADEYFRLEGALILILSPPLNKGVILRRNKKTGDFIPPRRQSAITAADRVGIDDIPPYPEHRPAAFQNGRVVHKDVHHWNDD